MVHSTLCERARANQTLEWAPGDHCRRDDVDRYIEGDERIMKHKQTSDQRRPEWTQSVRVHTAMHCGS